MASDNPTALEAQVREVLGKKVKRLRKQGLIPATVYGKGFEPVSVQLSDRAFSTLYRKVGKTALIELNIADQKQQAVFVQAVQRHPISRAILHVDLKVIDLLKPVQIDVPVVAIGESPMVARGDALLNHVINSVTVEALPAQLPQHIEVDISGLDELDKSIHVSDLPTSASYKILADADQVVLSLSQTRAAEEEAPAAEVSVEPELVRKEREGDDE
jgi:large subunit ribosomal protein L25